MGERPWNEESEPCRQLFCAAIAGIIANPNFFSSIFPQGPRAAVEFADEVVRVAYYGEDADNG
jgi:hypothetical protein